jgi:PAS domain S-box-containing protein
VLVTDLSGRIVEFNERFAQMWKLPEQVRAARDDRAAIAWVLDQLVSPDAFLARVSQLNADTEAESVDTLTSEDGRVFERHSRPQRLQGKAVGRVWTFREVTERQRAYDALRASEERYRLLFESNPQPMWVYDLETLGFLAVNEAAVRGYGYSREDLSGMTIEDIRPPEDVPALRRNLAEPPSLLERSGVWQHRRKDGTVFDVEIVSHTIDFDGRPARLVLAKDVTEQLRAEQALQESEARFRQMAETVRGVFWMTAPDDRQVLYISPSYESVWGRSCQSLRDDPDSYLDGIHPEDRARVEDANLRQRQGAETAETYRVVRPDGTVRWVRDRAFPIRDEQGRVSRITGEAEDITESKELEERLRQSQKMEAVGQLAGGIAHDFNNLLTAIIGYGELLAKRIGDQPRARRDIDEIHKAATRAASLTKQLLAFSRKQVLQPKVLDLNAVVEDVKRMLQRLIGEDVQLVTALAHSLSLVKADPGQLEQVMLNLAVNARDAMPHGGRLVFQTADVDWCEEEVSGTGGATAVQRYVMLAVADSGCGMDAETRARIFEPFFTTKPQGKGTGLGLATVYGIVQQSGGHVRVHSELGRGTTFRIYLPQAGDDGAGAAADAAADAAPKGSETVLLVEDDRAVRELAREVLEESGYQVFAARDGEEAIALCANGRAIDLLITDIVMPGMSGRAVAAAVRELRPGTRVICMSGYTEHADLEDGLLEGAMTFMQKPFSADSMIRAVRTALDAPE